MDSLVITMEYYDDHDEIEVAHFRADGTTWLLKPDHSTSRELLDLLGKPSYRQIAQVSLMLGQVGDHRQGTAKYQRMGEIEVTATEGSGTVRDMVHEVIADGEAAAWHSKMILDFASKIAEHLDKVEFSLRTN